MSLQNGELAQLSNLLPLEPQSLQEIITYCNTLSEEEASQHLRNLLGDSPQALEFIRSFSMKRSTNNTDSPGDGKEGDGVSSAPMSNGAVNGKEVKMQPDVPPAYAPPSYAPPARTTKAAQHPPHTNPVIEAAHVRARDEQEMQQLLQNLQYKYGIYNSDIEPEHETDYYCSCAIHQYQRRKWARLPVQKLWSKAVMYPGEKAYDDCYTYGSSSGVGIFSSNPYRWGVTSPYGMYNSAWGPQRPNPGYHAISVQQTIQLNNKLNAEAQRNIDAKEPNVDIWVADEELSGSLSNLNIGRGSSDGEKQTGKSQASERRQNLATSSENGKTDRYPNEKRQSIADSPSDSGKSKVAKPSKFAGLRKSIGLKTTEEKAVIKTQKTITRSRELRDTILAEEQGRWPDEEWRQMVATYQEKVGMTRKIADLRARYPTQYLHLLRAGYFEPIPVAWANLNSNPLKFSIESSAGWRGITPAWRGYEDTAEERLYWVLNHREGSVGMRMKPDFISEMNMARARMASAVEPPPEYYSDNDVCHVQHTSAGYSKQVMPTPFRAYDRPEVPTDDTMILLDVSGSMDFDPVRPNYDQYLITGYSKSSQPKNKG